MMKNKGFTIVEAILVIGIMTVIGLAVFYFSAHSFGFFADVDKTSRANLTAEEIRMTLESPGQCLKNFKDHDFITSPITNSPVDQVFFEAKDGTHTVVASVGGVADHGLKIFKMELVPLFKAGVISTGSLEITFDKLPDGSQKIKRILPFFAATESGKIKDCWISLPQAYRVTFQTCQAISGGIPNAYDPTTGKCTVMGMKWYDGTPYSATCAAPAILPAGANSISNCKADTGSWVDTGTITPLLLTDGTIYNGQRHPYTATLNTATNSCSCVWATDIDPSAIPSFKCQVLCISP